MSAKAAKASEPAAAAEYVAEHGEDVVHAHALAAAKAAEAARAVEAGCAKLVVARPLVGVAQYVVGLSGLFELLLGLLVARVTVRVIFDGHLLVSTLDFVGAGRTLDAKHGVIVYFTRHILY